MFNKFRNGQKVIVDGPGKKDGKLYKNIPAQIIERDPYYKDYHVQFINGTKDWISPKYIRKPYTRKNKRSKNKYES